MKPFWHNQLRCIYVCCLGNKTVLNTVTVFFYYFELSILSIRNLQDNLVILSSVNCACKLYSFIKLLPTEWN